MKVTWLVPTQPVVRGGRGNQEEGCGSEQPREEPGQEPFGDRVHVAHRYFPCKSKRRIWTSPRKEVITSFQSFTLVAWSFRQVTGISAIRYPLRWAKYKISASKLQLPSLCRENKSLAMSRRKPLKPHVKSETSTPSIELERFV